MLHDGRTTTAGRIAAAVLMGVTGLGGLTGCPGGGRSDADAAASAAASAAATGPAIDDAAVAVDDEAFDAALVAAEEYINTGDRAAAESILATALTRRPEDPRASELLGRVLMGRANAALDAGREDTSDALRAEAWEQYRVAAAGRPADAGLQTSAGLIGMTAGDLDGARVCFERAEVADPTRVQPPLYLGQIHLGAGDSAAAAAAFERVLALDPDEPYALSSLAVARMNLGDFDRAVTLAAEAREVAPRDAGIRLIEARVLRGSGRAGESLRRLLALPEDLRRPPGMAAEIAAAQLALDRPDEAAATWGATWTALPPGPERGAAAESAARAWIASGNAEEAWAWVGRARGELDRAALAALEAAARERFGADGGR